MPCRNMEPGGGLYLAELCGSWKAMDDGHYENWVGWVVNHLCHCNIVQGRGIEEGQWLSELMASGFFMHIK